MITGRVLVAYASKHGSTREVAERVAEVMRSAGITVEVMPAAAVGHLRGYDTIVLGGALYAGRLHQDARRFLARHRDALSVRSVAVFAMGPATNEPSDIARSRAQLDRALAKTPEVAPSSVAIFGGVIDPDKLRFPFNRMPASDARDWAAIEAWASELGQAATPARARSGAAAG